MDSCCQRLKAVFTLPTLVILHVSNTSWIGVTVTALAYLLLSSLSTAGGRPSTLLRLCESRTQRDANGDIIARPNTQCQPQTDAQLLIQLRRSGEFNDRYMGQTPDNFPDILDLTRVKDYTPAPFDAITSNRILKRHIEEMIASPEWSTPEVRSQFTNWNNLRTPEELNITRRFNRDVGEGHGSCKQRVFNLSMLRRTGNCIPTEQNGEQGVIYLEEWELYTQPIRVWCDCEISSQSFFANFV
ncbi:uncharacterized protein LOC144344601 [Saccoglossus kowalevskii]